jgi:hypothetical protein
VSSGMDQEILVHEEVVQIARDYSSLLGPANCAIEFVPLLGQMRIG